MVMRSDRFPFEILEIIFSDHSDIDIACKKEKHEINALIVTVLNMQLVILVSFFGVLIIKINTYLPPHPKSLALGSQRSPNLT